MIAVRNFEEKGLQLAINFVVYGRPNIKKFKQKQKGWHNTVFFIHEDDETILQWISRKKAYSDSRVYLKEVTNISDVPNQNILKKVKSKNLLVLTIGESRFLALDFEDPQSKQQWWQGIQHFWTLSKKPQKHE